MSVSASPEGQWSHLLPNSNVPPGLRRSSGRCPEQTLSSPHLSPQPPARVPCAGSASPGCCPAETLPRRPPKGVSPPQPACIPHVTPFVEDGPTCKRPSGQSPGRQAGLLLRPHVAHSVSPGHSVSFPEYFLGLSTSPSGSAQASPQACRRPHPRLPPPWPTFFSAVGVEL